MQFALTDEHTELVAAVRGLVARRARHMDVRTASTSEHGYDTELWSALCEQIGVAALAVPEEYGGAGVTSFETHVVLEELGRTLTPTPLFSSGVMAIGALLRFADDDAKHRILPGLAAGTELGALGIDWSGVTADQNSDGWTLQGSVGQVLGGDVADVLLVLVPTAVGTGLFEVALDSPSVQRRTSSGMDQTMRFGDFDFDAATATLLGVGDDRAVGDLLASITVANTAFQVGGAQEAFARTVAYLKDRVQFGRPLGSFQALKHRCADMMVAVESARSISWAAAWTASTDGPDLQTQAAIASSWCGEAFSDVTSEMVQLHGGIAITWEHDAHLYFKRAHATSQLFDSPHAARRTVLAR